MTDILIYICIILFGVILVKLNLLHGTILKRISTLQSIALYILLGAMGFKIGADKKLMSSLHILGLKSLVIAVFAILFSMLLVNLFYRGDRKW